MAFKYEVEKNGLRPLIRFGIIIFVVFLALTRPWINSALLSSFNFVISH